jgi:hypothetical protein
MNCSAKTVRENVLKMMLPIFKLLFLEHFR